MKSADNSCLFYDSKDVSSNGKTSNPNTTRTISSAGYEFCGEPLVAQHLALDFTPIDGVDGDAVAKKVCTFWDFIHATPEIQNLMIKPEQEVNIFTKKSTCANLTATIDTDSGSHDHKVDKTTIELLQFANDKEMLAGTQFPKSKSRYTIGSIDYNSDHFDKERDTHRQVCTCSKYAMSTYCQHALKGTTGLSKTVKEWDAHHPKILSLVDCWPPRVGFLCSVPNATGYMFTISCYTFHPLIQRFVRLWRYVQLVSDILACLLSAICCQCVDGMPLSTSSSVGSKSSVEVIKLKEKYPEVQLVDPGKSSGEPMTAQHLVIDFTPGREDTPEIQAKCQQFWQFARNRPELGGMIAQPTPDSDRRLTELSSSVIHPAPYTDRDRTNLPAIHMIRKMDKKGAVKAALNTGDVTKYYT